MASGCLFALKKGNKPDCDGKCKKGKNNYCQYYYVDDICKLLSQWATEAGVKEPLLIRYDRERKKLIIYTTKPGYLIGYHGEIINKYSELLKTYLRLKFTDADGVPDGDDLIELVLCDDVVEGV